MSERQIKSLKNPEFLTKFTVGQIVDIPRRVAYRYTNKLGVLSRPVLGRVISAGPRQVGKHYRFAVDIRWLRGVMEVWEEWQLEVIHPATRDQLQRAANWPYLQAEPKPEPAAVVTA
jgi:hypothetical protein